MNVRATTLLLALACLPFTANAADQAAKADKADKADKAGKAEAPEKPPVGTTVQKMAGGNLVETVLPGKPLAAAAWPGGGLAVLIAPEPQAADGAAEKKARPALYRVGSGGEAAELVLEPGENINSLAAWPSQDAGARELWLGEPGRISRLAGAAGSYRLETLLEVKGLLLGALAETGFAADGLLALPGVRRLRSYARTPAGTFVPAGELPLPAAAQRLATGLEISTPPVQELRPEAGGSLLLVGPQEAGPRRLRSFQIDPAAPAESRQKELWSRLAADEELTSSFYAMLGKRPYLIAFSADRGIFGKLFLNVLQLREDRTRAGAEASFRIETAAQRWFEPEVQLRDLDGDGFAELILIEQQGLSGSDLWISCYRGKGPGRFDDSPGRTKLDLEGASWNWGHDLDGDGRPDLLAEAKGHLLLYPGRALGSGGGKIVENKAKLDFPATALGERSIEVTLGGSGASSRPSGQEGAPRVLQLDPDPRPEVVLIRTAEGRAVVRILDLK